MLPRALALLLLALPAAAEEPNRFLAGVWPDRLIAFNQETLVFEPIGALRHGVSTGQARSPDGRFFVFVTGRQEAVEIFDSEALAVVDEFRLSTGARRIRIQRATPDPRAERIFLRTVEVVEESDRFLHDTKEEIQVFDRARGEIVHRIPAGEFVNPWLSAIHFSPSGDRMYLLGVDSLVEMDPETWEVLERVEWNEPLAPGFGAPRGARLRLVEPGRLFGIYRTTEPMQGMDLFGVLEIRLPEKSVASFEVGPGMRVGQFALSPDGKFGYAGLSDFAVIDMETREVVLRKKGFERGRTNTSLIVSADGARLFISGVGDTMYVHDARTLERETEVFAGGDFMISPTEMRRSGSGN